METKGATVKSIVEFVKNKFPQRYTEWLNSLPSESRTIVESAIYATNWYPIVEALIIPTKQLAILYNGDAKKAAWEAGRFNAEISLTGIYRIFIKVSSPNYIIERASKIFSTFYNPSEIKVIETKLKSVKLHILKLPVNEMVLECRIGGWMERALEINNCKNVKVLMPFTKTKGAPYTEYSITWD